MTSLIRHFAFVALALFAHTMAASPCGAATLWDWLSGRSPFYQPNRSAYYPNANPQLPPAVYPGIPSPIYNTNRGCATPTPLAANSPVIVQNGCPTGCQPYQANYAAAPWFRSQSYRVPVTRYRPVLPTASNGAFAAPQWQGCNTNQWQTRRVPLWDRPFFSWWRGWWPQRVPTAQPCAPQCDPCAGVSASPATPAAVPYYVPGSPGQTQLAPSPQGTVPADQIPQLTPGATLQPGARRPLLPPAAQPQTQPADPAAVPFGSGLRTRRNNFQVTPVPDPQAAPQRASDDIPQLLNPNDRTAHRARHAWAVVPISWPAPAAAEAPPAVAPAAVVSPPRWDASGWQSAR